MYRRALVRWPFVAELAQQHNIQDRAFASAIEPVNYEQNHKEAARDAAREDRSLSRSTAKLAPQMFAEMTGPGSVFNSGSASTSTPNPSSAVDGRG